MVCLNLLPVAFEKSYRLRQASCFIIKERNLCKKSRFYKCSSGSEFIVLLIIRSTTMTSVISGFLFKNSLNYFW